MKFISYNVHPRKQNIGDCVVRAIATAFQVNYYDARKMLVEARKKLGFKSYKERKFMYLYLWDYERIGFKDYKEKPTIEEFANMYPKGTYVISVKGHLTCISNGVLYDTWDSSQMKVCCAWKISNQPIMIRYAIK